MKKTRQNIVAGNWKMNLNFEEGRLLIQEVRDKMGPSEVLVILCPPSYLLKTATNLVKDVYNLKVGAQNCHQEGAGAYTGEIAASMIASVGAQYVILGHSERREYFGETDELLAQKVRRALENNLKPIFCVGERLETREANQHEALVADQLQNGLFGSLQASDFAHVIIAYEPVWAIGTGKTASPQQAQEMHAFIRRQIAQAYSEDVAQATSILYGGSCKPSNASEIFSQPDVDGGLIGGASLSSKDFVSIIEAF